MSGLGGGPALRPALLGAPGVHPRVDVTTHVIGAGGAFLRAQLPVVGPGFVVDTDDPAGSALRRHVHSVADRRVTVHPLAVDRLTNDLPVTGHPGVGSNRAEATNGPP